MVYFKPTIAKGSLNRPFYAVHDHVVVLKCQHKGKRESRSSAEKANASFGVVFQVGACKRLEN